jgi:hypothetical protein
VVTGNIIRAHWPELLEFYRNAQTVAWVREITACFEIYPSEHIVLGGNLNSTESRVSVALRCGSLHTALIYLTDIKSEDGGAQELVASCRPHEVPDLPATLIIRHFPTAGTIAIMDRTSCYHDVAPMTENQGCALVFKNEVQEQCQRDQE